MRFPALLTASSLGVFATLVAAGGLLRQLPGPSPRHSRVVLALQQHLAPDPRHRREAALLRASGSGHDPQRRQRLLQGQGWGSDALAAVVLKQQALDAAALGNAEVAERLWRRLLGVTQLAGHAASADALYALGRKEPDLRQRLLQRWPAHPAALAAASERTDRGGALHLARWGARWPGAQRRLQAACQGTAATPGQRQQLAEGLAQLGEGDAARRCLAGTPPLASTVLRLAETDLLAEGRDHTRAVQELLGLIQQDPTAAAAAQAVRLLAADPGTAAHAALGQLPAALRRSAAAQAGLASRESGITASLAVVQRWPDDPASWELQWQQARRAALAGRWRDARRMLQAGGSKLEASMPLALQARRRFWLGLSQWQLGDAGAARSQWQRLLAERPGGYYGWRAALRLGRAATSPVVNRPLQRTGWQPLHSGAAAVDELWRVGQTLEAWEAWRTLRGGQPPRGSRALLAEGRLREAIGDGWTGLGQQELASLRLKPGDCRLQHLIERSLHQPRQQAALGAAARAEAVPLQLLLGVAQQESRFQPGVRSVAGAEGLLQLMPETAAELAGAPLSTDALHDPRRNALLGARYLRQLLERWGGDPLRAVASYNAGPNAVARWTTPQPQREPEVWVEAIPYPETRHYVKAVLGNSWSHGAPRLSQCR